MNSRTYRIDSNQMSLFVLAIHTDQASHQQLATVQAVVLSSRYYSANYPGKNHDLAR
jgi:hypothetical protein